MSSWQSDLSFSERLASIVKMHVGSKCTAEHKSAHPDVSATEASQRSKALEAAIYGKAAEIVDYHHQCNLLIDKFRKDAQILAGEEVESETVDESQHGTQTIGRFKKAIHFRDGLYSDVYKSIAPEPSPESFLGRPGSTVALKVTYLIGMEPPHNSEREIRLLKKVASSNVIPLWESFREPGASHLVLVFPFMPYDLGMILRQGYLAQANRRTYLKDLFSALKYVHSLGMIHRDVKPSNILMKSLSGPAYLADFGIAWSPDDPASEPEEDKITDVGTTSYRPPEVLFGKRSYDQSLDLWAAGCVAAQIVCAKNEPFFNSGDLGSDLMLIQSIFKKLGTPDLSVWPDADSCPDWGKVQWVKYPAQPWSELLPETSEVARDLVSKLIQYQSSARPIAEAALSHPYFNEI